MSVQKDSSGRRSVQAEVEVPGTPEEVWRAIATGPGISSWFVPTDVEEREGGTAISHFGPGSSMDSVAKITQWNPPHKFSADTDELEPGDPPVATEWIVEARSGGMCVVRVVHSWFASSDKWDGQFEGHQHGWQAFFRILRLFLTHFPGQTCAAFQLMAMVPEPKDAAWKKLTTSLGLAGAVAGERVKGNANIPPLSGIVERVGPVEYPEELLIRLDDPAPGIAHLFAMPMGGQICMPVRLYLYGDRARAAVERDEPRWQEWVAKNFPAPTF